MNDAPTNIYMTVAFDLNKKIKNYIQELNDNAQIDLDINGYPYILAIDQNARSNYIVYIVRNSKKESFIINTRKRAKPIMSWDMNDGFQRNAGKRVVNIKQTTNTGKEREKRPSFESFLNLATQIMVKNG